MTPTAPRRRWIRWALLALALLVILPVGALLAFALSFDANAWKPRIEAAVQAATGRGFAIAGPIGTKLSLRPTVTLADVTLANPPGFSRPAMATVRRAEVQVALLPLLSRRIEVAHLVLDGADLLLERDAQGTPNWVLAKPAQPAPAPQATPSPGPSRPFGIAIDRVLLTESRIGLKREPAAAAETLAVGRLGLDAVDAGRRLRLDGAFTYRDRALKLSGETGPLAPLLAGDAAPWPVRLELEAEDGLALRAEGALTPPAAYRLAVSARAADLAALAPLLPDQPLPPLRAVAASAVLAGQGGLPAVSEVQLSVGASDLGVLRPGLMLDRATLSLPALDQPVAVEAAARIGAEPLTLAARLGPPAALLRAGASPWPVELSATAGAARLTLTGAVADPRAGTGIELALAAAVPQLAALAPLLPPGTALPPVRDISVKAMLTGQGAFLSHGFALRDLAVTSSAGDLAGSLALATRPRQALTGQLASTRLDLDALRPPQPPAATPPQAAQAAPAPAPAARPAPAPDRRLIPDVKLPLAMLRLADGDLRLTAQALRAGGADWTGVEAHAVLQGGRARLDPVEATLGGAGRIAVRAAADITVDPPVVQLALRSDALELSGVPAAGGASGRLGLDVQLRGRGGDLRSVAAGAFGHVGATLQGGSLPPALLGNLLAGLRQRVPGVGELASRPLDLSCVAARLDAEDGIAAARVLLAETSLGRVGAEEGAGTLSLRDERLALRLNADLRLPVPGLPNGIRIRAPVPVTGTLAQPRPEWNAAAGAALQGEVGDRLGRALGGQAGQILGALGGAIAGQPDAGPGPIPDCAAALALARGQAAAAAQPAPPAPRPAAAPDSAAPPAAAAAPAPRRDPVQDLLRRVPLDRLFGR